MTSLKWEFTEKKIKLAAVGFPKIVYTVPKMRFSLPFFVFCP